MLTWTGVQFVNSTTSYKPYTLVRIHLIVGVRLSVYLRVNLSL